MAKSFETQECSRCHGTGKHSFCESYRDVCFKCSGSGAVLTVRGMAAKAHFLSKCNISAKDVKKGDLIEVSSVTLGGRSFTYKGKVTEVGTSKNLTYFRSGEKSEQYYCAEITTAHEKFGEIKTGMKPTSEIRIFRDDDRLRMAEALEYQEILTKQGIVRKKGSKAQV